MKIKFYEKEQDFLNELEIISKNVESIKEFPVLDFDGSLTKKYNCHFKNYTFKNIDIKANDDSNVILVYKTKKLLPLLGLAAKIFNAEIIEIGCLSESLIFLERINPAFVYLFTDIDSFTHTLSKELMECLGCEYSIGVITAKDTSSLSWLLMKSTLNYTATSKLSLLPREKKGFEENMWMKLSQNDKMLGKLEDIFSDNNSIDLFTISSHGTEDCISLSEGIICGKAIDTCVQGLPCIPGEKCPVNKNAFMSGNIKSKIIFNNTCLGFRLNDTILPREANVTSACMEGFSKVYISSNTVKYGPDSEVCFFVNLVKHGYSLGEIVKIINTVLRDSDFDFNTFYLLGDPNTFGNDVEKSINIKLPIGQSFAKISAENESFFEIEVDESTYNTLSNVSIKSKQDVYFSKYHDKQKNSFKVFIYSWENFRNVELAINFIDINDVQSLFEELELDSWVIGLERYITGKNVHNRFTSLYSMLDKLGRLLEKMHYDASAYLQALKQKEKICSEIMSIQNKLIETLLDRASTDTSIWLPDAYIDVAKILKQKIKKETCFVCGSLAELVVFQHRAILTRRKALYCPRCGCVYERPFCEDIEMDVKGSGVACNMKSFTQTLRIKNNSNKNYIGFAGIRIDSSKKHSITYEPSVLEIDLKPYEERMYSVEIDLNSGLEAHLYYVKAFAMLNLNIYYSNKPVFIRGGVKD